MIAKTNWNSVEQLSIKVAERYIFIPWSEKHYGYPSYGWVHTGWDSLGTVYCSIYWQNPNKESGESICISDVFSNVMKQILSEDIMYAQHDGLYIFHKEEHAHGKKLKICAQCKDATLLAMNLANDAKPKVVVME